MATRGMGVGVGGVLNRGHGRRHLGGVGERGDDRKGCETNIGEDPYREVNIKL